MTFIHALRRRRLGALVATSTILGLTAVTTLSPHVNAWSATSPGAASVAVVGGTGDDGAYGTTVDASGNIITVGTFAGTVDFDPGVGTVSLTSNGGLWDGFITKIDSSGNLLWAKSFGGTSQDTPLSVTTDVAGNIYVTGSVSSSVDFDPGAGTATKAGIGIVDAFILKLDSSGNYAWAHRFGAASKVTQSQSVAADASGNVFFAGAFQGTTNFEPDSNANPYPKNLTSGGDRDIYVMSLNTAGTFRWAVAASGPDMDIAQAVSLDSSGNVFVAGYFKGTVDFGGGQGTSINVTSAGGEDAFIWKLNSTGAVQWARAAGGLGDESALAVDVDSSGNVVASGYFDDGADFDPDSSATAVLNVNAYSSAFVWKLSSAGTYSWAKAIDGDGTSGRAWSYGVVTDSSGNVYSTGYFSGTSDFHPSGTAQLVSAGDYEVYVWKLSSSGTYVWARSISGTGTDYGRSIAVNSSGDVFAAGNFQQTANFDVSGGVASKTSAGGTDVFVLKIDSSGASASTSTSSTTSTTSTTVGGGNSTTTTVAGSNNSVNSNGVPSSSEIESFPAKSLVVGGVVVPGQSYVVEATGFQPSESVTALLKNSTSNLGVSSASASGTAKVTVKIPKSASGRQTLILFGTTSRYGVKQSITVGTSATSLPETGAKTVSWQLVGLLMLAVGGAAYSSSRRKRLES